MTKERSKIDSMTTNISSLPQYEGALARPVGMHTEKNRKMIEEAAYYRAERRGFQGGDPSQDWIEAEAEIQRMVNEKASLRISSIKPIRK